jgi:hypothetical protein
MTMNNFAPPFREATFRGVPSRVFDKLGCAASEKKDCETLCLISETTEWVSTKAAYTWNLHKTLLR